MNPPVPTLAELLRWLAEMPPAWAALPVGFPQGTLHVGAVVADLWDTLFGHPPEPSLVAAFSPSRDDKAERNRLAWVAAACHLLWHPSLRVRAYERAAVQKILVQDQAELAAVAPADRLAVDEERREELIRRVLGGLGLLLPGETPQEAEDRLSQVDSVQRRRLLRDAADRERRSREVREAMARRAAEEAAAKVSRE